MHNNSNNVRIAQAKIREAIAMIGDTSPQSLRNLRQIQAQFGGDPGQNQQTFDFGAMGVGGGQGGSNVMPFRDSGGDDAGGGGGDTLPPPGGDSGGGDGGGLHPEIDSYVRPSQSGGQGAMVDERKTHKCAVTFKAPPGVGEDEMMNYILGIGKALGVDVDSFNWSKTEAKPAGGARGMG